MRQRYWVNRLSGAYAAFALGFCLPALPMISQGCSQQAKTGPTRPFASRPVESIAISRTTAGLYQYTIHGLLPVRIDLSLWQEYALKALDGKLILDVPNSTLVVTTPLAPEEFRKWCDETARGGGIIPYWVELETRKLRSVNFSADTYKLIAHPVLPELPRKDALRFRHVILHPDSTRHGLVVWQSDGDWPSKTKFGRETVLTLVAGKLVSKVTIENDVLEWETGHPPDELAPALPEVQRGKVRVNPITGFCMAESDMAVRAFGTDGKYIWEDTEHFCGHCQAIACDIDGDGSDEICVYAQGHKAKGLFIFAAAKNRALAIKPDWHMDKKP